MGKHIRGATILTYTGRYFDYLEPGSTKLAIEDIARGLANTCRFGGQCRRFYSVAEHCVLASEIAPPAIRFEVLMHDAAEAVVGDIPKPLKQLLPDFAVVEARVEHALSDGFGFPFPFSDETKAIDIQMLAAEQIQVMGNDDNWAFTHGLQPAPVTVQFWAPEEAYHRFMSRFAELARSA